MGAAKQKPSHGPAGQASTDYLSHAPRLVRDLMTPQPVTLRTHEPFHHAVDLLAKNPFRHLLVTEDDGRIAGVISDRDVLRAAGGYDSETTLVADVMTPEPITVHPETPLSEAVSIAFDYHINCLPVVGSAGTICGILTTTDLLRAFQNLQLAIEQLPDSNGKRL